MGHSTLPAHLQLVEYLALGTHALKFTGVGIPREPDRLTFVALRRESLILVAPTLAEDSDSASASEYTTAREVACLLPTGMLRGTLRHHARTFWLLCLTGMRPEEAFEEIGNRWEVEADGIRIHGTKSSAAERVVPRVGLLVKPSTKRQAFYQALRAASGKTVAPYDCRRTYAQWLDLARVPQFRQSYYLGHGPKNLDQLYQRMRACAEYLREDAAALGRLVGESVALRVVR